MDLKDKILTAQDRPYQDVAVPEWDCTVRVLGLSANDAIEYSEIASTGDDVPQSILYDLLVRTLADPESNELIFGSEDIAALGTRSASVLTGLAEIALEVSGVTGYDEAKNV